MCCPRIQPTFQRTRPMEAAAQKLLGNLRCRHVIRATAVDDDMAIPVEPRHETGGVTGVKHDGARYGCL